MKEQAERIAEGTRLDNDPQRKEVVRMGKNKNSNHNEPYKINSGGGGSNATYL